MQNSASIAGCKGLQERIRSNSENEQSSSQDKAISLIAFMIWSICYFQIRLRNYAFPRLESNLRSVG